MCSRSRPPVGEHRGCWYNQRFEIGDGELGFQETLAASLGSFRHRSCTSLSANASQGVRVLRHLHQCPRDIGERRCRSSGGPTGLT